MAKIMLLDTEISNKIAAGEVVERPASVVKELVENSIDAGANVITVEIKNGGTTYIRVADNGCGIAPEDAMIAFLRHATSKIRTAEDLDAIYTLGFRGEALSSIGAVAQVDLFTKRPENELGVHVICNGSEIVSEDTMGMANGTTITVQNLFFNTPARMKFLKKDATEAGYIADIMSRFILAHPEISFRFVNNGKEQLFSAGDNLLANCIYTVYGKDYAKAVLPVSYELEGIKVSGMIGKGDAARPNRNYQSFFINGRYIKSLLITRALEEAYKNQIMIGKFPVAVLNLTLDPAKIDINVHPTKMEVKFSDDRAVWQAVYHSVQNTLYTTVNIPKIERPRSAFQPDPVKVKEQLVIPDLPKEAKHWEEATSRADAAESLVSTAKPKKQEQKQDKYDTENSLQYFEKMQEKISGAEKVQVVPKKPEQIETVEEKQAKPEKKEVPEVFPALFPTKAEEKENVPVRVIGQIFDTYVLAQRGEEMLLIDQHAAHERIKFEELKQELENRQIYAQTMLVPVVVNLSSTESALFTEHAHRFSELGFEIEEFGTNAVAVRAVPRPMDDESIRQVVIELLENMGNLKNQIKTAREERLLYTIACKAAIKANHAMRMPELEAVVKQVLELDNINTCPHGRPIMIVMTKKELEKEFGRIV